MLQDLRFSLRMIRFRPWFSAAIVAVLALGIGANATVFTLVNAVLFKALPFKGGDRMVAIFQNNLSKAQSRLPISYPDYLEYRRQATSFESLEASWTITRPMADQANPPEPYNIAIITPTLLSTLGVQPTLGRPFSSADAEPSAPAAVLLSYNVWRDRYGLQADIVGRSVRIDRQPATIIGVMPQGFGFPNTQQLWMPLGGTIAGLPDFRQRSEKNLMLIGIRKPGVSISQSRADLSRISKSLAVQFPVEDQGVDSVVLTFHQLQNDGPIRLVFILMQAAVGVVLLIACANVANMMLSRALGRTREMSVRAALGASRWQILRQLLTESVLLSALGGILGLVLSRYAIRAFDLAVANVGKPSWILFEMDYTVFAYCAIVCLFSGLLFGLAPGLQASRVNVNYALKDGVRTSGSRRGRILSGSLVVLQFTFAVVLLAGAGMFLRGFFTQRSLAGALPLDQVLTARINLPADRYPDDDSRYRFYDRLLTGLRAASGVRQAAIVSSPPGSGGATTQFQIEGEPEAEPSQRRTTMRLAASPGYLSLIDVPVLAGRDFDDLDGTPGRDSIIITTDFASRFWPGQSALGKRLRLFPDAPPNSPPNTPTTAPAGRWLTVVGVGGNLEQQPSQMNPLPVLFTPYRPGGFSVMTVLLRAANNPTSLTSALRAEMQRLDPDRALGNVQTLAERADAQGWYLRVFGTVFLIFALIALSMASIGIYAVVAHNTGLRTQEIGIRMALGATANSVLRLVIGGGLKQLFAGLLLGLAAALLVTRLMGELLFRVSPSDPIVFGTVVLILSAVGVIACYLPARRAASMHPVKALRHE